MKAPLPPDTLAPVVMPSPVEVRPEDVDVDASGRVVLAVRKRGRVVGAFAAPVGASVVVARMLMDRRSGAVQVATGRPALLPRDPRALSGAALAVGLALVATCSAGCGWMAAQISAHHAPTEVRR